MQTIDASGMLYRDLNELVRDSISRGVKEICLINVNGQRYIGDGLAKDASTIIEGTPGNDLAAFMEGARIEVHGNVQDGTANTMNGGTIIIHGDARDALGYSMRGGEVYVRGDVGYRVGIHMKGYQDMNPAIVVGGKAGDFFAEYMAGGIMIVLGLGLAPDEDIVGNYCGTGMHGGVIYLRGEVAPEQLGKEVKVVSLTKEDTRILDEYLHNYCRYFGVEREEIDKKPFRKLIPYNKRPYGNMYAGW